MYLFHGLRTRARAGALILAVAFPFPRPVFAAIEDQFLPEAEEPREPVPKPVLTRPPELLRFANAVYPQDLLYRGTSGEVVLYIDIDERGRVARVEVVSTDHTEFAAPAMLAATRFVFSPAEIDYAPSPIRIEYKYIFTAEIPEPDAIAGQPTPRGGEEAPVNFRGLVREAGIRKPIPGAVIHVSGRPVTETGSDGTFELRGVPSGRVELRITSAYHDPFEVEELLADDEAIDARYYLVRTSENPYETTIRTRAQRREVSKIQLERKELEKVPGTSGDPIRVIENLPGMSRPPAAIGMLLVRGANPSDSQVFMDGVEIPVLYHFGGLTSVVNSAFLEEINHYPGGFGARYGRAIAGVVDVKSRDLDCDTWRGEAMFGTFDGHLYTCLEVEDWTVAGAARRSVVDAVLPWIINDLIPRRPDEGVITATPAYVDYQLKAHRRLGRQSVDIFAFGSDDRMEVIQTGSAEDFDFNFNLNINWHRILLRHRFDISEDTKLTTMVTPGYTRTGFTGGTEDVGIAAEAFMEEWNVAAREELNHTFNDMLTLNAGVDLQLAQARVVSNLPFPTLIRSFPNPTLDITADQEFLIRYGVLNHAYWAELVIETDFGLQVVPGFRLDGFGFNQEHHVAAQPRLNARWEFLEGMTAKAAYGWFEKMPEPQDLFEDLGNPKLLPLRSHQFILGYEHQITDLINIDIQGYYNLRERLPTPSNAVIYENGEQIEENLVSMGRGASYGVEILLRHLATEDSWFYGWIAYTLSRSVRQDMARDATARGQMSGGGTVRSTRPAELTDEYPSNFDQTHILTVVLQFVLPYGFEAGGRFRLISGNPYTPLEDGRPLFDSDESTYRIDASDVPRNSGRLPMFHQLDLRVDRTWIFDLWKLTLFVEVLNVYNAENVEQYQYDFRYRQKVPIKGLVTVPIVGAKGEF